MCICPTLINFTSSHNKPHIILISSVKQYTYGAEVQELDVSLTVVWNNNRRLDDTFGFKGKIIHQNGA